MIASPLEPKSMARGEWCSRLLLCGRWNSKASSGMIPINVNHVNVHGLVKHEANHDQSDPLAAIDSLDSRDSPSLAALCDASERFSPRPALGERESSVPG